MKTDDGRSRVRIAHWARAAALLLPLSVGCGDETADSASGSSLNLVEGSTSDGIADTNAEDGVNVDCGSLFDSTISITDRDGVGEGKSLVVAVTFPADAKTGDRVAVGSAKVSVKRDGGKSWDASSGTVVVDANDTEGDLRITIKLEAVGDGQGNSVSGSLNCMKAGGGSAFGGCGSSGGQ